ncbi:phosphoesterase RecJ domain protein [Desulfococcus multivorans DSM 2059]|uniref:Phosphoesterase RecJ domain protein n=1 Tax=Desulfococcus multivorans DSM 2059 TaxID=1121405 RepID=S7TQI3_DESML|nr:phosphoesterase RecJ domain protein [Desulfococcus multivorans DSM 2059]SJZ58434.1 phosphoesterase RecJ domain-containing protein [Desulfococcus multivorans DSM 2059]
MEKIIHHLRRSKRILLASHVNPDGDAVGALIALALALEKSGKRTTMYNESPIPAVYRFLPAVDRIVSRIDRNTTPFDAVVILDCSNMDRIGRLAADAASLGVTLNIDHHPSNTGFGDLQYVDTGACSTAEMVYRIVKAIGVSMDRDISTAIYTGILTDTGSFRFANTNQTAFSICLEMTENGVDPYTVAQHVYGTYSIGRIKLLNLALDSIEIAENGKLSFMMLTRDMLEETGTQPEDVDGMINYAKSIKDVKVAVLIQERAGNDDSRNKNNFYVSLRSDGSVDVAALAASFGGGGHHRAAGFCAETSLADLKGGILKWLKKCEPEPCRN